MKDCSSRRQPRRQCLHDRPLAQQSAHHGQDTEEQQQMPTSCSAELNPALQPLAGVRVATDTFGAINSAIHENPSLAARMSHLQCVSLTLAAAMHGLQQCISLGHTTQRMLYNASCKTHSDHAFKSILAGDVLVRVTCE